MNSNILENSKNKLTSFSLEEYGSSLKREEEEKEITLCSPGDWKVKVPSSKSLMNRALHLAALADGESSLMRPLFSVDTQVMSNLWSKLGAQIIEGDKVLKVQGTAAQLKPGKEKKLYVANAGTAARFITAILSLSDESFYISGNSYMNKRPFDGLLDVLSRLGVSFQYSQKDLCTPFFIKGKSSLETAGLELAVSCEKSSQFLSALLMLAPLCSHGLTLLFDKNLVSAPYVSMTLGMMEKFGVSHKKIPGGVRIEKSSYKSCDYEVEVDYSSASYFLALAAIHQSKVTISGARKESLQGDLVFVEILENMGCFVSWTEQGLTIQGPTKLKALSLNMKDMSDLVPAFCAVAMFAEGQTVIEGVDHMKYKECDRLAVLCSELKKIGLDINYHNKTLVINPSKNYKGASCLSFDDHRMAMTFSVVGTKVKGTTVSNPACVDKTFPNFFEQLDLCSKFVGKRKALNSLS